MSDYGRISKSIVKAIADALRYCNGNEAQYTPRQMPNAVRLLKKRLTQKTITKNGEYIPPSNFDGFDRVIVEVEGGESGGGSEASEAPYNDVIFIDCYGAIVYSYTAAQFSELSAMPENPSRDGLTAQGWNWTLSDAKAYVAKYGKLVIGQMYITDDGKTRIYIRLDKSRLSPYLGLAVNGTATIDWGDGNQSTVTGTSVDAVIKTQHVYASQGEYTITIDVNGSAKIVGDSNLRLSTLITKNSVVANENRCYLNTVQKVEIGRNVDIGNYAFQGCYSISSLAMPRGITGIGEYAICACYGLHGFTIPSGITSIGNYAFSACYGMEHISIPNDVESIGNYSFNTDYNLANVTLPESVETIGGNAFYYCYSLSKIIIPDNVVTIGSNAFNKCYSIVSVLIPSNVTSIDAIAFENCYGIAEIHFHALTPPTIESVNTFTGIPTDCKIYVPTGTLSAYTSALYYPDPATYTYIEE